MRVRGGGGSNVRLFLYQLLQRMMHRLFFLCNNYDWYFIYESIYYQHVIHV